MIPGWGRPTDTYGARLILLLGILATDVLAFPFFWLIESGSQWAFLALLLYVGLAHAAIQAPQGAVFFAQFPALARYLGTAVSQALPPH